MRQSTGWNVVAVHNARCGQNINGLIFFLKLKKPCGVCAVRTVAQCGSLLCGIIIAADIPTLRGPEDRVIHSHLPPRLRVKTRPPPSVRVLNLMLDSSLMVLTRIFQWLALVYLSFISVRMCFFI